MKTRFSEAKRTRRVQSYRRGVRSSHCRGLGRATCRRTAGCRQANGTKRRFCRKSANKRR